MPDTLTRQDKLDILTREWDRRGAVVAAARALLERLDVLSGGEFNAGDHYPECEALRQALGAAECPSSASSSA